MTDQLFPRPRRRMKQPRKDALRRALDRSTAECARLRMHVAAMAEARQHDHDAARRVPRWIRALFGA